MIAISNIKESLTRLNDMILNGKILDAFEQFYHEDVIMQENEMPPTIGKTANRKNEEAFVNNITAFRGAEVKQVLISKHMSVVDWHFDFDHREWGTRNYRQLAIQRWKDGQIIAEHFIYES